MVGILEAELRLLIRKTLRIALLIIIALLLIVILWVILNWYIAPTAPGERKDVTQTLAQIVAGIGFLGSLYFTWRTVQVNREVQVTDRFTKAIAQLGDDRLEIRLGGIYALERISCDSERDYGPIMEVLTAYVRDKAPILVEESLGSDSRATAATVSLEGEQQPQHRSTPSPDIQAILTVLGRRHVKLTDVGQPVHILDLQRTDLRGASLWEANLGGAYLGGADLRGAYLTRAILWRANLGGAYLGRANLGGANLGGADLREASLWEANLLEAKGLTQEQIDQTYSDDTTKLPDDLRPPQRQEPETEPPRQEALVGDIEAALNEVRSRVRQ